MSEAVAEKKQNKPLSELRDLNRKARTSEDPQKVQEFHKACGALVRRMEKEGGVIGNAFRELDYLGKGKPNDSTCKLTGRYARQVLREESSIDMQNVIISEKLEEEIRSKAWKKREDEASRSKQVRDGVKTTAGIVKLLDYGVTGAGEEITTESYSVYLEQAGSSERKRTGIVGLTSGKVRDAHIFANKSTYEALIKNNFNEDDRIADITLFYPFMQLSLKQEGKLTGKGVGTAVLSQVLKEFESKDVIGVSCYTEKKGMQDLLEWVSFQKIGENVYFRRFKETA